MSDPGLDLAIPYTAGDPDPTLPWADDDDNLLVPGSLGLFEPAHSANPISGVPSLGADVPNIAWKRLRDLLGSSAFTGSITGSVLTIPATPSSGLGTVKQGQTISGTGITAGTYIGSQVTSTEAAGALGGAGTYNVAGTTTASSAAITAAQGTQTSLSFSRQGLADSAGAMQNERSTLGGWHTIMSQTNNTVANQSTSVQSKTALQSYLMANPDHSYYFSVWDEVTRVATANQPSQAQIGNNTSNGMMILDAISSPGAGDIPSAGQILGHFENVGTINAVGNRFRALAWNQHSGTLVNWVAYMMANGTYGPFASLPGSYGNKSASRVTYRVYLEDLTVSGRTYAQVEAADYALYQAAFSAGGRYYGDTVPTNPSTVP
jgi:hypothetical protein